MKEFRLAAGWRFISYLFCIGFIGLALYLLYKPLTNPFRVTHVANFLGAFMLLVLTVYLYRDTRYGKFIIDFIAREITLVSSFRKKTIPFDEIKGYRKVESYIYIVPLSKKHKRIRLSTYLSGSADIETWLSFHYSNIDDLEAEADHQEISTNEQLGITEETRLQHINGAKRAANAINAAAWVVTLWTVLYPHPYTVATSLSTLVPLLALFLCYYYNGLMKGGDKVKSGYPTVVIAFVFPGMGLLLRSLYDYSILSYSNGWLPILVLTMLMYILYMVPTHGFKPRQSVDYIFLFIFPFLTFIYSFGSLIVINGIADQSKPKTYQTTILSKHISKGRVTTYDLELRPWGTLSKPHEVSIKRVQFEKTNVNDTVTVVQYEGYLKMPWIDVNISE